MKLPLVFFLLVSSPIKAQSETLIQSQNLTTVDYQALLQTGKYKSYVTYLLGLGWINPAGYPASGKKLPDYRVRHAELSGKKKKIRLKGSKEIRSMN